MTLAKKLLILVLLLALTAPMLACGVGSTPAENRQAAIRVADYDARMLVDDLAVLIQVDRPVRNSRWVID